MPAKDAGFYVHLSHWIRQDGRLAGFSWQEGYCALTVSPSARSAVGKYIAGQEAHHHKRSFREELIGLLEKASMAYDAKYLD